MSSFYTERPAPVSSEERHREGWITGRRERKRREGKRLAAGMSRWMILGPGLPCETGSLCFSDWALVPPGWFTPNLFFSLLCLFARSLATAGYFPNALLPVLFVSSWQAQLNSHVIYCQIALLGLGTVQLVISSRWRTSPRLSAVGPSLADSLEQCTHVTNAFVHRRALISGNCSISANVRLVIWYFIRALTLKLLCRVLLFLLIKTELKSTARLWLTGCGLADLTAMH